MGSTSFSRRTALRAAMIAALGAGTARTAGSAGADPITIPLPPFPGGLGPIPQPPSNSPLVTSSPPLRPYVDDLWVPPAHRSGAELTARAVRHRYHADLPPTRAFGYGDHILGPTITAHSGEELALSFGNRLGEHPLAEYVDESMMATTGADRTDPRTTVHLHGAPTAPASDGFPTICWRRNGMQHNRYGNRQEAATLWYHDHAVGITRLNVQAGLAGVYLVRDAHDTGEADNPLGLPAGERELPLVLQDRTFKTDGSLEARQFNFLPHDMNQAGQLGDVAVVNGVAWPRHRVARGLYRLRVVLGANGRVFRLQFSNSMRFWVIGGDQGLLDAPQAVRSITMSPGERADLLVDFGSADGGAVDLMNTAENSIGNALFVVPTLRRIMRFHLSGPRERARVPETLRGGPRRPPRLPAPVRPTRRRTVTLGWDLATATSSIVPLRALMLINNLDFMSDDVDVARAGTVERWDIVNSLPIEHPIHLHLAVFRVIERHRLDSARYFLSAPPPAHVGTRWSPAPSRDMLSRRTGPEPWELGWKDTVLCPEDSVTSILVYWPTVEQLGFDPDAPIPVPHDAEVAGAHHGAAAHSGHGGGARPEVRGYVWHSHNLDHEDHDMMQRIRVQHH